MWSFFTATDGKAPIATVEEEDDDVPGKHWSTFAQTFWIVSSLPFDLRLFGRISTDLGINLSSFFLFDVYFSFISDLVENFDEASKDEAN